MRTEQFAVRSDLPDQPDLPDLSDQPDLSDLSDLPELPALVHDTGAQLLLPEPVRQRWPVLANAERLLLHMPAFVHGHHVLFHGHDTVADRPANQ
jgi:hypothetical protein